MTDCTQFIEAADQHTSNWNGLLRERVDNPGHTQHVQFVTNHEDFENSGAVIFAVASGDSNLEHVSMSIHAFVDGKRVTPTVLEIGDELIITIQNA